MHIVRWRWRALVLIEALCVFAARAWADPPAQKLPSALLVYPFVEVDTGRDTRIELLNLSGDPQTVECFYVVGDATCQEVGFVVSLTPYQPVSWLASEGFSDPSTGSAVPPFFGDGEMKCVVAAPLPGLEFHNTIQGRATVFGSDGKTVSYGAVAFQRLNEGDFTGVVSLDGFTYAQCPDKLHFDVIADQPTSMSELILVPCSEDLLLQVPSSTSVQFLIINEFEQTFSTSIAITCFSRTTLGSIVASLNRADLGSDTAHVIIRGTAVPLLGLVIDSVPFGTKIGTAGNEPSFQGGRSAQVVFP
jgi:hypothetical protein